MRVAGNRQSGREATRGKSSDFPACFCVLVSRSQRCYAPNAAITKNSRSGTSARMPLQRSKWPRKRAKPPYRQSDTFSGFSSLSAWLSAFLRVCAEVKFYGVVRDHILSTRTDVFAPLSIDLGDISRARAGTSDGAGAGREGPGTL